MSRELQPPVLSVSLVKIELPTVIKDEPPQPEIGRDDILDSSEPEEEIIPDVKGTIDIVYHPVCEDFIKSEILESYHCESVETQVLVNADNSPFIKTENITQRNKTEDTSDENVTKGTGQAVVEVQASHEHSNALSKLNTNEQYVLNFSKNVNGISVSSRKSKSPKKTDFDECYKTDETTLWEKEKIKVIKAPVIPVETHEYASLANDRHVCNHCQYTCNILYKVKVHIKTMHREVTTMYQCPNCPYKSKWKHPVQRHIIQKHKDTKDIQWFQCHLCEKKFKFKDVLTKHKKVHLTHEQMQDGLDLKREVTTMYQCPNCPYKSKWKHPIQRHIIQKHKDPKDIQWFQCHLCEKKFKFKDALTKHKTTVHLTHEQMQDGLDLKRHHCDTCEYKTCRLDALKMHKLSHLKPEEIDYFYCYHCSYKSKTKEGLKRHIFRHHFKNVIQGKRYGCNECGYESYKNEHFQNHKLTHLKPEEIQYFYCHHCSYKGKRKWDLKIHIFRKHYKNVKQGKRYGCNECSYKTYESTALKNHKISHLKPEEIQYLYCYHCSYKAKRKNNLKRHILRHFKKEQVEFDCYICNFMTPKRELIIKHLKKHSKVRN